MRINKEKKRSYCGRSGASPSLFLPLFPVHTPFFSPSVSEENSLVEMKLEGTAKRRLPKGPTPKKKNRKNDLQSTASYQLSCKTFHIVRQGIKNTVSIQIESYRIIRYIVLVYRNIFFTITRRVL